MITINNNMYVLDTDNTSYVFAVLGSGQLEHLYYGRKLHANEMCFVGQRDSGYLENFIDATF